MGCQSPRRSRNKQTCPMLTAVFSKIHLNTKLYSVTDIKPVTILWGRNTVTLGNARSYSLCCQCDLNRDLGVIKDGSIRMIHLCTAADSQDGRKGVRNPARPTVFCTRGWTSRAMGQRERTASLVTHANISRMVSGWNVDPAKPQVGTYPPEWTIRHPKMFAAA